MSQSDQSDHKSSEALIQNARDGDSMAQFQLYDEYVDRLLRHAGARIKGDLVRRYDPEDVVNSVFASFFEARNDQSRLGSRNDLWRLLIAITTRKAAAYARHHLRKKRTVANEVSISLSVSGSTVSLPINAVVGQPSDDDCDRLKEVLKSELDKLSDDRRRTVQLHLGNKKSGEIAKEMGVSLRTVQRRLDAFRRHLKGKLSEISGR